MNRIFAKLFQPSPKDTRIVTEPIGQDQYLASLQYESLLGWIPYADYSAHAKGFTREEAVENLKAKLEHHKEGRFVHDE